ncbi:MAG: AbrB/MazE/SpoVT family DNA-binding domain-containing protein [Candidatus Micrarchaeota archaeon]
MEFISMSSKGQIVIPKEIRHKLRIEKRTVFAVLNPKGNLIVLKKVESPSIQEDIETLESIAEAWREIENGQFKRSTKEEFLRELDAW